MRDEENEEIDEIEEVDENEQRHQYKKGSHYYFDNPSPGMMR